MINKLTVGSGATSEVADQTRTEMSCRLGNPSASRKLVTHCVEQTITFFRCWGLWKVSPMAFQALCTIHLDLLPTIGSWTSLSS